MAGVRIEITVQPARVPCGDVTVDGGGMRPFTGWLQLLSILGELLPRPVPNDFGGKLEARTDPELGQGV